MISDVLFQASDEITRYLEEFSEVYSEGLREKVLAVQTQMDWLRRELDMPLDPSEQPEPFRGEK